MNGSCVVEQFSVIVCGQTDSPKSERTQPNCFVPELQV